MINPSSSRNSTTFLFLKESKESEEYFCTLCEAYIKEKEHKSHLFEGVHKGETLGDFFVRAEGLFSKGTSTYVCVICWMKLGSPEEIPGHRVSCSANNKMEKLSDESEEDDLQKTGNNRVSPPIVECQVKSSYSSSRRRKQTQPMQHISPNQAIVIPHEDTNQLNNNNYSNGFTALQRDSTNCFQCSLCSVLLPSTISYISHLKSFHRISSNTFEKDSNCPLCLASIPLLDLSDHLISLHGLVPQTAVNSLVLWVLTNFQKQIKSSPILEETASKPLLSSHSLLTLSSSQLPPGALPSQQHLLAAALLMNGGNMDGMTSMLGPQINDSNNNNSKTFTSNLSPKTKLSLNSIVGKLSRTHVSNNKQSFQCFLCSKWFALLPVKHMKLHILRFKQEKLKYTNLINGQAVCLTCYAIFGSSSEVALHYEKEHGEREAPNGNSAHIKPNNPHPLDLSDSSDPPMSMPLSLSMTVGPPLNLEETSPRPEQQPTGAQGPNAFPNPIPRGVELDNAGRVKSGKVRKQCELCGEWSNIKWFFKHMSEVHQALFCRCCREYLPIPEQEDHRRWHAEPPYMGQKIRIENGQPIIIDRKERASLTPIGSLAPWGGSSGGMVVKAIDEANCHGAIVTTVKKRKPYGTNEGSSPPVKMLNLESAQSTNKSHPFSTSLNNGNTKDTLMPKETCPVCGILITYKNLARHIKLRHKIKYKFCHKCRKLVPNSTYDAHKASHSLERGPTSGQSPLGGGPLNLITNEVSILPSFITPEAKADISSDLMDLSLESVKSEGAQSLLVEEEDIMEPGSPLADGRKSESFRANTSKTKLESLLGKEFKHPRRKCALCGYSVSYSNFKRHLRNAHLSEYLEVQNNPGAFKKALQTLALEDRNALPMSDESEGSEGSEEEEDPLEDEEEGNKIDCPECGERILEEYLPTHLKINHHSSSEREEEEEEKENEEAVGEEEGREKDPTSPKKEEEEECVTTNTFICPFCSLPAEDAETLNKHTKAKHKTSIKWCQPCSKYLSKKTFKSHCKTHVTEQTAPDEEESSLLIDTSNDGEQEKTEEKPQNNNVFSCQICHKIFLAAEAYQTHLAEKHESAVESIEQSTAVHLSTC
eukprot:TRINITY_DN4991_c0_g1_i1.p1 TRINITY_DN4991_c0_g1~~TRINITY_DN4991_c0_g1_i1.p1  ORF type:complete len:1104 (+),score=295.55 TRINITY_DN4991_c0_g1_i1:143-3454(+)